MTSFSQAAIDWAERGRIPDSVIRQGIRQLCRRRLDEINHLDCERTAVEIQLFLDKMKTAPTALLPALANTQHYEVPAAFFEQVLGPHRKYSCCHWPDGVETLAGAEAAALSLSSERADLQEGQSILELGCGWGSLSLWMAEHYPSANITAVSNSHSQRRYIESLAAERKLTNLSVITADMNDFDTPEHFDRVVSVEMFEHMRNWQSLFRRIHGWLHPDGRFFLHIFCHRDTPYLFVDRGEGDWMSRYFFSGGMMPSDSLPLYFQEHLSLTQQWRWCGKHYEKTANAWLANMDRRRETIMPILAETYGSKQADIWWQRWRLFFIACAETFAYDAGQTWWVSHYLFERGKPCA